MDIDAAPIFVRLQAQAPAAVQSLFSSLSDLYEKKLWFEFTTLVDKLFKEASCTSLILPIYRELILPLAKKISPDAFVKFTIIAAGQLGDAQEAIGMLLGISEQYKTNPHLYVYARMSAAFYQLQIGQVSDAKSAIDECLPLVEAFAGVNPSIKASFYKVRSEFDKVKALFSPFYRDAFLYLACVKTEELSVQEKVALAHDLSIAALLGESVYNFGELLMHPVLDSIKNDSDLNYLVATLEAFNSGDHEMVDRLLPTISKHSILGTRIEFLRQKLCLMALVECVFSHLKQSRRIPFTVISEASRVPLDQIEFLLIKALSLGIIKGSIDGVEQELSVEWVQPRVLNMQQLVELRASIQAWRHRISEISKGLDIVSALPDVMTE